MTLRNLKDAFAAMTYWAGVVLLCIYIGGSMLFLFSRFVALLSVLLIVALAGWVKGHLLQGERETVEAAVEAYGAPEGPWPR